MKNKGLKIIPGIIIVLAYIVYIATYWINGTFGIGLEELIFTLTSPLDGTDMSVFYTALRFCIPRILVVVAAYVLCVYICSKIKFTAVGEVKLFKKIFKFDVAKALKRTVALLSVVCLLLSIGFVDKNFDLIGYVKNQFTKTQIYDEYYVDPAGVEFSLKNEDGEYKNLIYIYLESMETTYTSTKNGGSQDICYIPKLSKLAKENISFSDSKKLGGFHNVGQTGYTMGALLGSTSGIPFCFPTAGNGMENYSEFAPGLTTLGDILEDFGYNQEFLCGSDAKFAGRRNYFEQHGNYQIFDYFTAQDKNYIDDDYYVFWGFEDEYLYEIAKDEALRLSKEDEPFNLTMLTVDTHHVEGYVCDLCKDKYDTQTKNVVSCADRQIAKFIDWCKKQEFFEDTVIIISGDHPRMDSEMVKGVERYDRTMYNCFINCEIDQSVKTTERTFTVLDMFPTTLQALGFEWGSSRLGLGTSMFSGEDTLAEQLGYEYLDEELSKKSKYVERFYK